MSCIKADRYRLKDKNQIKSNQIKLGNPREFEFFSGIPCRKNKVSNDNTDSSFLSNNTTTVRRVVSGAVLDYSEYSGAGKFGSPLWRSILTRIPKARNATERTHGWTGYGSQLQGSKVFWDRRLQQEALLIPKSFGPKSGVRLSKKRDQTQEETQVLCSRRTLRGNGGEPKIVYHGCGGGAIRRSEIVSGRLGMFFFVLLSHCLLPQSGLS